MQTNSPRCKGGSEKRLFVARTVVEPQRELSLFARGLKSKLGSSACIRSVDSMHLTIAGSEVAWHMRKLSSERAAQVCVGLEAYIKEKIPNRKTTIEVNVEEPLHLYGTYDNVLGIKLRRTEQLEDERAYALEHLTKIFGRLAGVEPLDPHIAVGRLRGLVLVNAKADFGRVLGGLADLTPPAVELNGIELYRGAIHSVDHYVAA